MDRKALVGLLSGISLVIATLIGVAVLNTPVAQGAGTTRTENAVCSTPRKATDQGYGLGHVESTCPTR